MSDFSSSGDMNIINGYKKNAKVDKTAIPQSRQLLFLDPRPVRHTERISDLFYILFRREKSGTVKKK